MLSSSQATKHDDAVPAAYIDEIIRANERRTGEGDGSPSVASRGGWGWWVYCMYMDLELEAL